MRINLLAGSSAMGIADASTGTSGSPDRCSNSASLVDVIPRGAADSKANDWELSWFRDGAQMNV
jgi:hypothetical protein